MFRSYQRWPTKKILVLSTAFLPSGQATISSLRNKIRYRLRDRSLHSKNTPSRLFSFYTEEGVVQSCRGMPKAFDRFARASPGQNNPQRRLKMAHTSIFIFAQRQLPSDVDASIHLMLTYPAITSSNIPPYNFHHQRAYPTGFWGDILNFHIPPPPPVFTVQKICGTGRFVEDNLWHYRLHGRSPSNRCLSPRTIEGCNCVEYKLFDTKLYASSLS